MSPAPKRTRGQGTPRPPRLLIVVNVDWFFLSHRLPIARAARAQGLDVVIAAADTGESPRITREGLGFVPVPFSRKGTHPVTEAAALLSLVRLYRRLRPDIVHHVTIKPVLFGSAAARAAGAPRVVNAISGLGYVFSSQSRSLLRRAAGVAYRFALRGPRTRTIFQNPEDRDEFVAADLVDRESTVMIRGSGVDLERFRASPEPPGEPVVMLASRLLWDKGVGDFVDCARRMKAGGVRARFVLVGRADDETPTAVSGAQLRAWADEGVVEWWGQRDDMPEVLSHSAVVVLPTFYKEGLPKVLLEAAAVGRPLVATDIPGCREIVQPDVNGILVPVRDVEALAAAVGRLLDDPALRRAYGAASRALVQAEFSEAIVVERTLAIYRELLGPLWPAAGSE